MITGNIEEVLYLSCGNMMEDVAEFCGRPRDTTNFVVTFEEFQEMHEKKMIGDDIYFDMYLESNIVEIVAIF